MNVKKAIQKTEDEILFQRRMLCVLKSEEMNNIAEIFGDKKQHTDKFDELFKTNDVTGLRDWLFSFVDPELGGLGVRTLRKIASAYMVPFYYRLTKIELIQEITHARRRKNRKDQTVTSTNGETNFTGRSGT